MNHQSHVPMNSYCPNLHFNNDKSVGLTVYLHRDDPILLTSHHVSPLMYYFQLVQTKQRQGCKNYRGQFCNSLNKFPPKIFHI